MQTNVGIGETDLRRFQHCFDEVISQKIYKKSQVIFLMQNA
jgi:hypothetical protein